MTSCQQKVVFLFNKFYYSFVEDLIKTCESLKNVIEDKCKVRNIKSDKNIERFKESLDSCECWRQIIAGEDLKSVSDNVKVIKSITLKQIFDELKDEKDVLTVECYTYIFTLFAYLYGQRDEEDLEELFTLCTNAVRDIQKGDDYKQNVAGVYDEKVLALLELVNKSMAKSKVCDVKHDDDEDQNDTATMNILENSKIGNLAKEISEEIDLSSIKVDKPEDIIGSLMSGDGALNNIIGKVGSKIQSKIQSGEIKHEELLSDAFSMLNMLNKNGGGGAGGGLGGLGAFMNNPMFSQMMKGMQGGGGMFAQNNERSRATATKDRLKKKHDNKHGQ